jgi:hypothetical protein
MFPSLTANNQTNKNFCNIKLTPQRSFGIFARGKQAANLVDLRSGELGFSMLFTLGREKVTKFYRVVNIMLLRRPLQILKAIVRLVAVLVVRNHSVRAWTDKGFEHQDVDKGGFSFSILAKRDSQVSPLCGLRVKDVSAVNSPNTTNIADFVDTFVSDNRFPDFHWNLHTCKRHQDNTCVATRQVPDGGLPELDYEKQVSTYRVANTLYPVCRNWQVRREFARG